jgi:Ca2+:H+ antiporter
MLQVWLVINIIQIYNNTVTQMSACLLSLSVMSLLLPVWSDSSYRGSGMLCTKTDE